MLEMLKSFAFGNVLSAIVLAILCLIVIKLILKIYDKLVERSSIDPIIRNILRIAVKAVLLFMGLIIVLSSLGISVTSLVAALSVVGVAFSLAIQGFLSNVFGGIQIISNKPFSVGDFVDAGGESGVVQEVGLFYTKLHTGDKKLVQIPNSVIANSNIINYSSEPNRRVDITVTASYDDDTEKVKAVLMQLICEHPKTLSGEGVNPMVRVSGYNANDIAYTVRAWCAGGDYWDVYFDLMDAIKPTFDKNGISMSYPHVNVHMIEK
jgi:small conductance mechanosensitive channel